MPGRAPRALPPAPAPASRHVRRAKVIAITRYGRSPLQKLADVVLHTLSPETAYRSEAMASRMAQLALIDTLMVALYLRRQPGSSDLLGRARRALEGKRL